MYNDQVKQKILRQFSQILEDYKMDFEKEDGVIDRLFYLLKERGYVIVPQKPTLGLLMSMAIRGDHALGVPGYYDQALFGDPQPGTHQLRLDAAFAEAKKLYEEIVGEGFYHPEREDRYIEIEKASKKVD